MSRSVGKLHRWWFDLKRRAYWRLQPLLTRAPAALGRRLSRPQSLYLKLTLRCSARCLHCDVWRHMSSVGDELSTDEWKDFLRSVRRWLGPTYVCLTGGEALLRRDALDLLRFSVDQGFSVQFLTNGYAVTDEIAEQIVAADPDIVAISLDAMDAALYDRLRGRTGFFERATAALQSLVAHHRRLGAKGRIIVKTVIMDPTLDEMIKVLDWVESLGTARVFFQPITQNYDQEPCRDWYENPDHDALWVKNSANAAAVMDELIARLDGGAPIENSRKDLELTKAYFLDPATWSRNMAFQLGDYADPHCPSGLNVVDISSNGDVRTCPMCEPLGNLRQDTLRRIWRRRPACWKRPCPYWRT